jgi:hypothetical protein
MVTLTRCDRCSKEMPKDPFFFGGFEDEDVSFDRINSKRNLDRIVKPHLCNACVKGYNNIILATNKEIRKFLKDK